MHSSEGDTQQLQFYNVENPTVQCNETTTRAYANYEREVFERHIHFPDHMLILVGTLPKNEGVSHQTKTDLISLPDVSGQSNIESGNFTRI